MILSIERNKEVYIEAGNKLEIILTAKGDSNLSNSEKLLYQSIFNSPSQNPWFTVDFVKEAFWGIRRMLLPDVLEQWLKSYKIINHPSDCLSKVLVVMAGNIPFVGFHDMLCVLLTGHTFLGKLSSQDKHLPAAFGELLIEIEPTFRKKIIFYDEPVKFFDAVIATGSNNSARYFDYYFGKYPHIIRQNRNSVAILTGKETDKELADLGKDIFLYFGMGCRNVAKLLVPQGYDFTNLLDAFQPWEWIKDHSKYANNYDYQKAVYLVNGVNHFDNGFVLLSENQALSSPLAVLNYEYYENVDQIKEYLNFNRNSIQCVVASGSVNNLELDYYVLPGESQNPGPGDYADGVDTLEFLLNLKSTKR